MSVANNSANKVVICLHGTSRRMTGHFHRGPKIARSNTHHKIVNMFMSDDANNPDNINTLVVTDALSPPTGRAWIMALICPMEGFLSRARCCPTWLVKTWRAMKEPAILWWVFDRACFWCMEHWWFMRIAGHMFLTCQVVLCCRCAAEVPMHFVQHVVV